MNDFVSFFDPEFRFYGYLNYLGIYFIFGFFFISFFDTHKNVRKMMSFGRSGNYRISFWLVYKGIVSGFCLFC